MALAVVGVAAAVLGLITVRLSGHFLPLGTIAWGLSLYYFFGTVESFGGYTGPVIRRLEALGFELDESANLVRSKEPRDISTPGSKVRVLVIPTNEELAMAEETLEVIGAEF